LTLRHAGQAVGTLELLEPQAQAFAEDELDEFHRLLRLLARVLPRSGVSGWLQPPHRERPAQNSENQAWLDRAYHQAPFALAVLAPDGCILEGNAALGSLLGGNDELGEGTQVQTWLHEEDVPQFRGSMRRLLGRKWLAVQLDQHLHDSQGGYRTVTATYSMLADRCHQPLVIAQFQDAAALGSDAPTVSAWQRVSATQMPD
jgi:PAS domain-containing protein